MEPRRHEGAPALCGVLVLGAGRSGTSSIASSFIKGGFFAGRSEDLLGPAPSNPLGHFEPLSVLRYNESLLGRFGCTWWSDAPSPELQHASSEELVPHIRGIVQSLSAQAGNSPIVIKEPRINGLLPLWGPVVDEYLHPVLTIRDPVEVALSHLRRDGTSPAHALGSWEVLTTLVLEWLDGRDVTIAPYSQLMTMPSEAATVLGDAARHLDPSRTSALRPNEAEKALQSDLRHEHSKGLEHRNYLTQRQAELWAFLKDLKAGAARLKVPSDLVVPNAAARLLLSKENERIQFYQRITELEHELSELKVRMAGLEEDSAIGDKDGGA